MDKEPICDKCMRQRTCKYHMVRITGTVNIHYPRGNMWNRDGSVRCFRPKLWFHINHCERKFANFLGLDYYDYLRICNGGKDPDWMRHLKENQDG